MGIAIALGDAGDDIAIQRVALVGPVDGDPESLSALPADDAGVIGHGPTRPFCHVLASICGRTTVDCKRDLALARRRCLPDPDLVVVERSPAARRYRLGSREHVDAAAADMGLVGVDRLRDQHATAEALEHL